MRHQTRTALGLALTVTGAALNVQYLVEWLRQGPI